MTVFAGQYLDGQTGTKREPVKRREWRTDLNEKYNKACVWLENTSCNLKGIKTYIYDKKGKFDNNVYTNAMIIIIILVYIFVNSYEHVGIWLKFNIMILVV